MAKNSPTDTLSKLQRPTTSQPTQQSGQQQSWSNPLLSGTSNAGRAARRSFNAYDILSRAMAYKQISPEKIFAKGEQTHQDRLAKQEEYDRQLKEQQKAIHDFGKPNLFSSDEDRATFKKLTEDYEKTKAEKKALDKDIRKGIDWEGRDALIDEYKKLDRAGYLNPKMAARKEEIRKQLDVMDRAYGNGERDYGLVDRAQSVISAAGKSIAEAGANWVGNAAENIGNVLGGATTTDPIGTGALGINVGKAVLQETDPEGFAAEQQATQERIAPIQDALQQTYNTMHEVADTISESAARDLTRAKEGLNALERAGVDMGVNALQMAFDGAAAAVTGVSSLNVLFARAAGSAIGEARRDGASSGTALIYGTAVGAVEKWTENMFDGVIGSIYGPGVVPDVAIEAAIRRLSRSKVWQTLARMSFGAAGEAIEEGVSGVLGPVLRAIYTGKIEYKKEDWEEILYSMGIGGALGFLGAGTQIFSKGAQANAENAAISSIYDQMGGNPSFRQELYDRNILSNLQSNPNYYANPTIEQQADEAVRNLAGQQSEAQRATDLQAASKAVLEAQVAEAEAKNGVVRRPDGTVQRNGVQIKSPATVQEIQVSIILRQSAMTAYEANYIAHSEEYCKAFTALTGIELSGNESAKAAQIYQAFHKGSEAQEAPGDIETPAQVENTEEQASDELNNRSEEANQQEQEEAPKNPRIGPKKGEQLARAAYEQDIYDMRERRADEQEEGVRADIENDTFNEDFEAEDQRLQQEAEQHGREIDRRLEQEEEDREKRQPRRASAVAERAYEQDAYEMRERRENEREEGTRADIGAEDFDEDAAVSEFTAARQAAAEAAAQEEADRTYEERRKNGQLTKEEKATAKVNSDMLHGEETNKQTSKILDKIRKLQNRFAGKHAHGVDHTGTFAALDNLAAAVEGWANGTVTTQELYEAYAALNGEDTSNDMRYFFEGDVAGNLKALADLEETALESPEKYAEYSKLVKNTVANMWTKLNRLDKAFNFATRLNNSLMMSSPVRSTGTKQSLIKAAETMLKLQFRIDQAFRFLGGNNPIEGKAWYELGKRAEESQRRFTTIGYNARSFFYLIQSQSPEMAKAWENLENGKLKGNVDVPGVGKLSLNYELSLLKTLESGNGLEQMADYWAELANEGDYYKNKNNNGFGDKRADHQEISSATINSLAEEYLHEAVPGKATAEEWAQARREALEHLRDELKADIMKSPVAKAAYEASFEVAKYLAREANKTCVSMFGYEKATLGDNYYPLQDASSGNSRRADANNLKNINEPHFLQHRNYKGGLKIVPFVETMMNYTQEVANWAAYGELVSDLQMMDKPHDYDDTYPTLSGMIGNAYGTRFSDYLSKWENDVIGNRPKQSEINRLIGSIRKNIAQASLTLNPAVALKQTPSYYAAAGLIDYDVLLKARMKSGGPFRPARSYDNNQTIREIDSRTGVRTNRFAGWNTIELGEALENNKSIGKKAIRALPAWARNMITERDVSTVSNIALACADQVTKDIENGDPKYAGIEVGSDEYYDEVTKLFEEVVNRTQPIYDPQFRPEMLRSDNELMRSAAMFRTQQGQDFNEGYLALAETRELTRYTKQLQNELDRIEDKSSDKYKRTKAKYDAAVEELNKAKKRGRSKLAGFITSKLLFSALSIAGNALKHSTKKLKDEEGEWSAKAMAKQLGFGAIESAAGTVWLGDTLAELTIDLISGTFGTPESEFYSISESTTALLNETVSAIKTAVTTLGKKDATGWQKARDVNKAAMKIASAYGIPAQNAYNILNAFVMYGVYDSDPTKNFDNNDDFMRMMANYSKMSDASIANATMERVIKAYGKGRLNEAETLLATLNFESNSIVSNVKSDVKSAYIAGDLTEAQTRKLLKDYCRQSAEDIEKLFEDANRQIEYDKAKAANEKAFESVEALLKSVTDKRRDDERPRDYYEVDAIVGSLLSDKEKDVVVDKNLSATYRTNYNALRGTGMKPTDVTKFLETVDTDANGRLNQDEMYNWYLLHKGDEKSIKALWDAQGYEGEDSKTWADFKESKKNMTYDQLSAERANDPKFVKLEEAVKELKDKNSWMMQNADSDPAIFDKISSMGLSDENFDAAVTKYVSSNGRKMYNAARGEGLSPKQSLDVIRGIDAYYQPKKPGAQNNNYLSVVELVAYYRDHPEQEDVIKALYYATTTSSKSWEEQKAKTKTAGVTAGK